jgi:hypothetical protein
MVEGDVRGKAHLKHLETYSMVLGADGQPRPELFVADQIHFNAEGCRLLADRVRPYLELGSSQQKGAEQLHSAFGRGGRAEGGSAERRTLPSVIQDCSRRRQSALISSPPNGECAD